MTLCVDLAALSAAEDAERSPLVGPSDVGVLHGDCMRRLAYRAQGHAPSDPVSLELEMAAEIGKAIHARVAAARIRAGWTFVEKPTPVRGLSRWGTLDGYDGRTRTVDDLKSVSRRVFDKVLELGKAREGDGDQAEIYALALTNSHVDVECCSVTYVCRDTGRTFTDSWTFDPAHASEVLEALVDIAVDAETLAPDEFGRVAYNPTDKPCDSCPFRTKCWGGRAPEPEPPVLEDAHVQAIAAELHQLTTRRRELDDAIEQLRALIGPFHGYEFTDHEGIRRTVKWTSGRLPGEGGPIDQKAARRKLEAWGEDVPTIGTAPRLTFPAIPDKRR